MLGELISLGVAVSWTIAALASEVGSKRLGVFVMNVWRMAVALLFSAILLWLTFGKPYPAYASATTWLWLLGSGVVGYFFGDWCLFNSYLTIGSRMGQLFMTLAPMFTAFAAWVMIGQTLSWLSLLAMCVTLLGIAISVFGHDRDHHMSLNLPLKGILYGIGAAMGQGFGLVLSKIGLDHYTHDLSHLSLITSPFSLNTSPSSLDPSHLSLITSPFSLNTSHLSLITSPFSLNTSPSSLDPSHLSLITSPSTLDPSHLSLITYHLSLNTLLPSHLSLITSHLSLFTFPFSLNTLLPFASNMIRCVAGLLCFTTWLILSGHGGRLRQSLGDRRGLVAMLIAVLSGPFIGVGFSLMAVQYTAAGIASTIMAMTPILILLPSRWLFGQPITPRNLLGAVISVIGVSLFFL